MQITLRPADDDDIPFLRALFLNVRRPEFAVAGMTDEQLEPLLSMQFAVRERSFAASYPDAFNQIVLFAGEPVGNLLTVKRNDSIHLIDISILEKFRRKGIGRNLIEGLKNEAEKITLTVYKLNQHAIRLYEKLDFRMVGEDGMYNAMEWKNA